MGTIVGILIVLALIALSLSIGAWGIMGVIKLINKKKLSYTDLMQLN
ncbi:hypothetical protein [Cytobacillus pseudoceanisediminis]